MNGLKEVNGEQIHRLGMNIQEQSLCSSALFFWSFINIP